MKKLFVLIAIGVFSVGVAQAYETGTSFWHDHSIPDAAFVDTDTDTDTQRQEFGYGVGADVVVLQTPNPLIEAVEVQGRYDIELKETRVFAVAKVNLWEALGGK